jgi:hypothetical protein
MAIYLLIFSTVKSARLPLSRWPMQPFNLSALPVDYVKILDQKIKRRVTRTAQVRRYTSTISLHATLY